MKVLWSVSVILVLVSFGCMDNVKALTPEVQGQSTGEHNQAQKRKANLHFFFFFFFFKFSECPQRLLQQHSRIKVVHFFGLDAR